MKYGSLCLFLLVLIMPLTGYCQDTFTLNTANDPPNSTVELTGICDRTVLEAFGRMGKRVRILNLPSERALINANDGIDDGNFARVEGLTEQYPNLVMVPEPVTTFDFVAISKKRDLNITGWASLAPYHVGFITGWKILEANIKEVRYITKVQNETLLFNLLLDGKVDLIIYDKKQADYLIRKNNFSNLHVSETPLASKKMYIYLNKKHEGIVSALARTIQDMKRDGSYQKIYREALGEK